MPVNKLKTIRTRIAPSPTGFMHIGNLRTALYSYLFAKQHNGQFVIRIEDTDVKRYTEGAIEAIYKILDWAGLKHDEGPDVGGPYGPYIQSQQLNLYQKYADELVQKGHAYYCFCTPETLEQMRQDQTAKKQAPKYNRRCLALSGAEVKQKLTSGEPHVIRMKIPENRVIEFDDIVRGKVSYNTNELDDQVILKSDGYPTYHLAVVVDDYLMKITHVTRTEEWLPSTPKHILLYEYFGWELPKFAHLPLLLNVDKTKMSKRKGDVAIEDYIKKGYLPEAMINYLAFLGWNPGTEKEIYSFAELLKDFDLRNVHKAGAIFNIEKLNWYNQYYIKQLDDENLFEKCKLYLPKDFEKNPKEKIIKMLNLEKERAKTLSETGEDVKFFFTLPEYDKNLLVWKDTPEDEIKKTLKMLCDIIENIPETEFTKENLQAKIMPEAEKLPNRGIMLWPMRAALSGQKASPGPFEIADILGKDETMNRLQQAIDKLR